MPETRRHAAIMFSDKLRFKLLMRSIEGKGVCKLKREIDLNRDPLRIQKFNANRPRYGTGDVLVSGGTSFPDLFRDLL